MAEDRRPQQHTHTPATVTSSPSLFSVGGWFVLIRLLICSSWLSCCLVPLARMSCSVRGVGCSRPEPWTRLHCSELHWRDPVALSVGQPGAREQQNLRTWIGTSFSESVASSWPTRWVSGVYSGVFVEPLGCDDAMHCRYGTETKTLGKHLNSSAGHLPTWRPVTAHVQNLFSSCNRRPGLTLCFADSAW